MQRLLIADDHRLFADGLRFLFQYTADYTVIDTVPAGADVLPALGQQPVDLLLLDVSLPDLSGPVVARAVRHHWPALPILAVSMDTEAETVRSMLQAGANGYCPKTADQADLMRALDAVGRGETYLDPSLRVACLQPPVARAGAQPGPVLTPREQEVADLLLQGLSNTAIAGLTCTSPRTVETHRKNLYAKLGVHNVVELATRLLLRA